MKYRLLRFTPGRSLTYNNRWHVPKTKRSLFFIPPDEEQFRLWLDFLCTRHRRSYLYLHTIVLRATRARTRVLKIWKGRPLREVVIRERDYGKRVKFRTQRISKSIKAKPKILKQFGL